MPLSTQLVFQSMLGAEELLLAFSPAQKQTPGGFTFIQALYTLSKRKMYYCVCKTATGFQQATFHCQIISSL